MVRLNISNHVGRCYSNEDGYIIQNILKNFLIKGDSVTVSFKNIDGVTSSFVNTAFIELLNDLHFDVIKRNVRFEDTTKQINEMIKNRFAFEINRKKSLASV